ncbi:TIGR01777 family oxidoreductase [Flavobacterium dauae]|uniref:TIGR01777 family oxidoreductase n=1 Tax=Flavobacterium dauae TaxID=1563479 RepID=UPI00101B341A|nr:TIGR01777 family oxidoreductase [Flavobacterium dauae]WLD24677.1 TIGR01777 family oxidoreductase [Flavobacterium dauae]
MKILVTGATGFIGTALCSHLLKNNHSVHYLVTDATDIKDKKNYKGFLWNPEKNEIDLNSLAEVDAIVNLAGHTINCKWTDENKKQIHNSRINCSNTLFNALQDNEHQVKFIVNASAIGIYQSSETAVYTENSTGFGDDFLATVCKDWEAANLRFEGLGIKTAITRFGLILSKDNGVLHELAKVVSKGLGANLGNGKQWMSWIHFNDVIQMIYQILNQQQNGIFNVVAPNPVRQNEFLKLLASQLNKPLWLPNIPSIFIKIGLGERSALVLSSQHVQSVKLPEIGCKFMFTNLESTLKDLYKSNE